MSNIQVLDQLTIDKIAAGEVIERPASIIKELVENSIDANSTAITVEIKDGGITLIRISDNGCGIPKEEVPLAFLRHSTSKIRSAEDLSSIHSLGFRGEALSSIAAVAQVELITKPKDALLGTTYRIEGGIEKNIEETCSPDGSTFLVHQIFYNTPARRKFLKTPMTEGSHVHELMIRLALSHPEISFQFINNGQTKLHTSGNGKLKDVIYHIYGREIANELLEVQAEIPGMTVYGYIGKPLVSRGNRNFENYYINGRYVKSQMMAKAIEDAYKDFTMQHKYPFTVLHFSIDGNEIDVNVHPTKSELRFSRQQDVYQFLYHTLHETLTRRELIPEVTPPAPHLSKPEPVTASNSGSSVIPEKKTTEVPKKPATEEEKLDYFMEKMKQRVSSYHQQMSQAEITGSSQLFKPQIQTTRIKEAVNYRKMAVTRPETPLEAKPEPNTQLQTETGEQLHLFDTPLLSRQSIKQHHLIGQLFSTYWLVEFQDQLYIIDQHAAHERILYEKTLHNMKEREFTSQYLSPPLILNLTPQEQEVLLTHLEVFTSIGFEFEPFGTDAFALRAVPDNLFGIAQKELLLEMLDQMADGIQSETAPDLIVEKIASMSCKAAVKGNSPLSVAEVDTLIQELLELENPYHCPHGRPTIISMSKRELEKKFKRIV